MSPGLRRRRSRSAPAHLARCSRKRIGIARNEHDIGARLRDRKRDGPAEAAAAPGDKYALTVQPEAIEHSHAAILIRSCRAFILADNVYPQIVEART
jgi:hypothetical protein